MGKVIPLEQRFWSKVDAFGDCWEWTGARRMGGYGAIRVPGGKITQAHRVSWELLVGSIPEGFELDHLCRNPPCVNPDHLEPVTKSVNMLRSPIPGHNIHKTSCPQGHPYDDRNTHIGHTGARACRTCARDRKRRERQLARENSHAQ